MKRHPVGGYLCGNRVGTVTSTLYPTWGTRGVRSSWLTAGLLLTSLLLLMPRLGHAQAEEVASGGKILFADNCMVCHGQGGKGDGIMVTFNLLNVTPPDLSLLGKRNGGHFPFWRVYGVIDGRDPLKAHGSREMPLWGDEFRLEAGSSAMAQSEVRAKLLALVYYLQSIQQK